MASRSKSLPPLTKLSMDVIEIHPLSGRFSTTTQPNPMKKGRRSALFDAHWAHGHSLARVGRRVAAQRATPVYQLANAAMPVMARPKMGAWMSCVPS